MCDLPIRKPNRLDGYDYSSNGAYFVTICSKNRENLLGRIISTPALPTQQPVGATVPGRPCQNVINSPISIVPASAYISLTKLGKYVDDAIQYLKNNNNNDTKFNEYVLMPNHVHIIIVIRSSTGDRGRSPLHIIVRNIKSYTTKQIGFPIWQKSFHDRIIRNQYEYFRIAKYIKNNPATWADDCFHKS